jgi:hypothetical protein
MAEVDNIIDRGAVAILKAAATINSPKIQDDLTPGFRLNASQVWAKRYARAVIEAIREPTQDMVAAANRNNHPRDIDTWRTMIDAALATRASDPAP